ncbi:2-oxo acid dehydrogenase subunit E2 [Candidatus Bathyarchaeota archaeon]|nr:2-oxo acid dehydrogenase subunit E2 [Candidatus Bathyarchaeota archaeon]
MPKLSLTMKEGTVGKWYKKEGDIVNKEEPLVEVVSEKATYDVEAPASGILRKILVEEGLDVPVNEVLAVITNQDEEFLETHLPSEPLSAAPEKETVVLASPAAKRLAREQGVDLSLITGTGPEGRIVEEDVERFVADKSGKMPKIKDTIALTGLRKTSAERLSMSFRTAPHSTVVMEVDVSKAVVLHEKSQVSYTAILVKAVASALVEHQMVNSSLDENRIKIFEEVNVGIAVATENGLIVPVIHNANGKSLEEIGNEASELTEKARKGKLSKEELSGGTFTVTNLGMYDVDFFVPIINPPEAAILGAGRVNDKPVVVDGRVEIRSIMVLSLSYDHRIIDGAPASGFLRKVKEEIEKL